MTQYTNTRESPVSMGGVTFKPRQTLEIRDEIAATLETRSDGILQHPLRRGTSPTLVLVKNGAAAPDASNVEITSAMIAVCADARVLETWFHASTNDATKAAILARADALRGKTP